MQEPQEELFQIATLVVVVMIVIVCMGQLLIFMNPRVAINPFKPPPPTGTAFPTFPATYTPTETSTPTNTFTPTPTYTPTPTDTPTPVWTNTPTITPSRTRPPRTNTPRPPTASPYSYDVTRGPCEHSGGTFIEGYVNSAAGPLDGVLVRLGTSPGGGEIQTISTGGDRAGHYTFVLRESGARPGTWYVWIVDSSGRALSDPNAGRVVTNDIRSGEDPNACWRAEIHFGRR
ncbi:MAG: hypothetical protein AB1817_10515 [Chloroflexota bacterium]